MPSHLKPSSEVRALLLGLDNSGKTSVLYKWKLGDVVNTIPTIGFNVENVTIGKCEVTIWDVGGQDKIRPLWRHYLQNTNVVVWVVDASDRSRLMESSQELRLVMESDDLKGVPLVVLANKCDMPSGMCGEEVAKGLGLESNPTYFVIEVSAISGHNCGTALSVISRHVAPAKKALVAKKTPAAKRGVAKPNGGSPKALLTPAHLVQSYFFVMFFSNAGMIVYDSKFDISVSAVGVRPKGYAL